VIEKLPADATLEDAIERLVLLVKTERGLAALDAGQGVDHTEAKRRLRSLRPACGRTDRGGRGEAQRGSRYIDRILKGAKPPIFPWRRFPSSSWSSISGRPRRSG
jgi:hypothetical protein